jgi:hypothetical protein
MLLWLVVLRLGRIRGLVLVRLRMGLGRVLVVVLIWFLVRV